MSTAAKTIKWNKQLPAHSVSIEIYSAIARFTCDNTDFKSIVFSSQVKSHFIQVVDFSRGSKSKSGQIAMVRYGTGDSQV